MQMLIDRKFKVRSLTNSFNLTKNAIYDIEYTTIDKNGIKCYELEDDRGNYISLPSCLFKKLED